MITSPPAKTVRPSLPLCFFFFSNPNPRGPVIVNIVYGIVLLFTSHLGLRYPPGIHQTNYWRYLFPGT
ncbi:hypothetical protein FPSE5266_20300 [Fusarium pseudograminearum]|nr:hypothetical protein FPSE5266_20300 [Fusarium pseudograminearum]